MILMVMKIMTVKMVMMRKTVFDVDDDDGDKDNGEIDVKRVFFFALFSILCYFCYVLCYTHLVRINVIYITTTTTFLQE